MATFLQTVWNGQGSVGDLWVHLTSSVGLEVKVHSAVHGADIENIISAYNEEFATEKRTCQTR